MKPTAMLYRNLMAMDVEECIRAYPLDAVVLLGGCDKTVPGAADGRRQRGRAGDHGHGRPVAGRRASAAAQLGAGTDLWHYADELRAGRMTRGGVRRARGRRDARLRPLQRDGHRVDDDLARRGARHVPAREPRRSPPSTPPAPARPRRPGARAVELAREGLAAVADPHRRGVRQRDHRADGDRRRHERRHPPARARRPRRRPADARPLRRALAAHAADRERPAVRRAPRRAAPPRRRHPAPCCTSSRRCCTATRSTVTGRTLAEETSPAPSALDRDVIAAARRPARAPRAGSRSCAAASRPTARSSSAARPRRSCSRHRGPARRLRGHLRRRARGSTTRPSSRPPTPCSCCATRARRAGPGCRSGVSCRSRSSCSSRA